MDQKLTPNPERHPDHLVDQYKTANNWKTYANQILPISQKP